MFKPILVHFKPPSNEPNMVQHLKLLVTECSNEANDSLLHTDLIQLYIDQGLHVSVCNMKGANSFDIASFHLTHLKAFTKETVHSCQFMLVVCLV